jgi:hypothetical protein
MSNTDDKTKDLDLELIRNNFVSAEYFNLELKLKKFLSSSLKEIEDMQQRVNTLQLKVPERTLVKKGRIIASLIKFDVYLQDLKEVQTVLYDSIDVYNKDNSELVADVDVLPTTIDKKPYKKRNPKPVPKPKKPRDLTE